MVNVSGNPRNDIQIIWRFMKLEGQVSWYSKTKGIGFIAHRVGNNIERYFLSAINIIYCEPLEPRVGCGVKFDVDPRPPRRPEDAPKATNIEIFEVQG